MIQQELCIEGEPGAGIKYMHIYDNLHRIVRERLQTCTKNICLACLEKRVQHKVDPYDWIETIEAFEQGDPDVHNRRAVQDSRRRYEEERFRGLYGNPISSATTIYDTIRRAPRSTDYIDGGIVQRRMEEWIRCYKYAYVRGYDAIMEAEIRKTYTESSRDSMITIQHNPRELPHYNWTKQQTASDFKLIIDTRKPKKGTFE